MKNQSGEIMGKVLELARTILVLIMLVFAGLFGFLFCLLRPFAKNNSYYIGKPLSTLCLKIMGMKLIVLDRENLEIPGSKIFVSNHQHNMDLFINAYTMPKGTVSMGKKSLAWLPFFGQMYWLAGNVLIDRSNKRRAKETIDNALIDIEKTGKNLWIMPEGTRVLDPKVMLPFKKGAFNLAVKGGFPIVPVAVSTIKGKVSFKKWNSGTVYVKVLPAISTESLDRTAVKELAENTHKRIYDTIRELDKRK